MAITTLFTPFPNLELTRRAMAEGFFTGDVSELPHNMTSRSVLKLPDKAAIERLQKLLPVLVNLPRGATLGTVLGQTAAPSCLFRAQERLGVGQSLPDAQISAQPPRPCENCLARFAIYFSRPLNLFLMRRFLQRIYLVFTGRSRLTPRMVAAASASHKLPVSGKIRVK